VFADEADLSGGEPLFFQIMAKPANGARAKGSNRDQEHGIHAILF
jgi:hypothetical protein